MPRPSPLACTTAVPAGLPETQPTAQPPAAPKRRGNPHLDLIPRCGARTRAGCACRAPAIHGKLRCRMHGGRSTGPRTAAGLARLRAARTTHGGYSAETRALNRQHVSFLRRSSVRSFAVLHPASLPPELAARMKPMAPELLVPPRPTHGISRAEDRAMLQAETAALAPWKQAMAQARQARRAARDARATLSGAKAAARAKAPAPERAAGMAALASAASPMAFVPGRPEAHAPILSAPAHPRPQPARAGAGAKSSAKSRASERGPHGGSDAPLGAAVLALLAVQPKPLAPIPSAPAQPTSQPAPASASAEPSVTPPPSERAAYGCSSARPPAQPPADLAALPEAHAPIPSAQMQPASQPAPASVRAEPVAKAHAPDRASHGVRSAAVPADLAAQPKAHAPIPPTPTQPAPASPCVEPVATPHAPASTRAEPAATPHAPKRARKPDRVSRPIPAGRAARRWLRQQKRVHPHQAAGSRP
jgi:hypothetical protein